jgi:thiol-disulfide isomerase/thioredoxin
MTEPPSAGLSPEPPAPPSPDLSPDLSPMPPSPDLSPEPSAPPARRGGIGPFSRRQLLLMLGVVAAAALVLFLVTRPIAPASGTGDIPTALPGATPFLIGEARTGPQPGDLAPELAWTNPDGTPGQLLDLDGNPVRLEELRGKLVWLNFWATWCPPCQAETPVLREMDERYRDQGLAIVGVAVQETTVDNVREYADRYGIGYPIAFDASADIFDLYRVYALPTQFLIGPDGVVRKVMNGPMSESGARAMLDSLLPATPLQSDPGQS